MSCIWNSNGLEKHCEFCTNIYCDARENTTNTLSTTNQKEMNTYEEKYKKALERAKTVIKDYKSRDLKDLSFYAKSDLETIFPELKEDDDEIIRKELISYLSDKGTKSPFKEEEIDCERFIAWLEKQKTIETDYDKAFDEFLDSIPEKDPESCNSLYTYEDLESAIKFGVQWQKRQKPVDIPSSAIQNIEFAINLLEKKKYNAMANALKETLKYIQQL